MVRPRRALVTLSLAGLASFASACGEEIFDDEFGGVDLQPYFADTATGRVPSFYRAGLGFHDGERMTFYNFRTVAVQVGPVSPKQREIYGNISANVPQTAYVNPMYFFFDHNGNPMFSWPIREIKTGNFVMGGGEQLRDPNPAPDADRRLAYPVRARRLVLDPRRNNSADYQRPIIDNMIEDKSIPLRDWRYSGLWEVIKVRAPRGYRPDSIKSWRTLRDAWNDGNGSFEIKPVDVKNPVAINCPLVDSRTLITPTVAAYAEFEPRIPQPLLELWYRKKRINCFLVNGWEALGRTEVVDDQGNDRYVLYRYDEDDRRLSTFDVEVKVLGQGKAERRELVAPVGRMFLPRITGARGNFQGLPQGQDVYLLQPFTVTTGAFPRRSPSDPPGYRPLRWLWGMHVESLDEVGLEFDERWFANINGTTVPLTNINDVERSRLFPILATVSQPAAGNTAVVASVPLVYNYAMSGRRLLCTAIIEYDKRCSLEREKLPPAQKSRSCAEILGEPAPEDPCPRVGLVCPFYQKFLHSSDVCEPKRVTFGEYCAPSVAECFSRNDVTRVETYASPAEVRAACPEGAGPITEACAQISRRVRLVYRGDIVEEWFFLGRLPPPDCDDEDDLQQTQGLRPDQLRNALCFQEPMRLRKELYARVPPDWRADRSKVDYFVATPFSAGTASTFICKGDDRGLGHCYMQCDGGQANKLQGQFHETQVPTRNGMRTIRQRLDSRCGGLRMPGYRCLPITNRLTEGGGNYCAREADPNLPDAEADALCQSPTGVFYTDVKNPPAYEDLDNPPENPVYVPHDIAEGTRRTARTEGGIPYSACLWDVGREPR